MRAKLNPRSWPISLKVPLVVAVLMVAVSALISERVLNRLTQMQQVHLQEAAATYMEGLAAALLPHVLRDDVWEAFDTLDRSKGRKEGLRPVRAVVVNGDNQVLASSDPRWLPVQAPLPLALARLFVDGSDFSMVADDGRAYARRAISHQGRDVGTIFAEIDIEPLLAERRNVLTALLVTNTLLTLMLAAAGYIMVRGMLGPVRMLAQHLDGARRGDVSPIPDGSIKAAGGEFGRLFRRYNAMVRAMREREMLAARLADEEKMASLGRLASGMAHEINNPLGGMFNSIDALKRHGQKAHVRQTSLRLLEQGLAGIRDVVRAALVTYRGSAESRALTEADLDDLRLLIAPEIKRKGLRLEWRNSIDDECAIAASAVRQAILNLLLNACAASPEGGLVTFWAERLPGVLVVEVGDSGCGLPEPFRNYLEAANSGAAPMQDNSGLGLWMVRRLSDQLGAAIDVSLPAGGGTLIAVRFPLRAEEMRNVA